MKKKVKKEGNMKKNLFIFIFIILVLGVVGIGVVYSMQGSTWTTKDCMHGAGANDEYKPGEMVYIYVKNFDEGLYHWTITGQSGSGSCNPNQVIAQGDYYYQGNKEDCFRAYTIKNRECGIYKVDFGGKTNNYKIVKNFCALEVYGNVYQDELGGEIKVGFPVTIRCNHGGVNSTWTDVPTDSAGEYSVNFLEGTCAIGDPIGIDGCQASNCGIVATTLSGCNTKVDLVVTNPLG
jgi:hypothetical protein